MEHFYETRVAFDTEILNSATFHPHPYANFIGIKRNRTLRRGFARVRTSNVLKGVVDHGLERVGEPSVVVRVGPRATELDLDVLGGQSGDDGLGDLSTGQRENDTISATAAGSMAGSIESMK